MIIDKITSAVTFYLSPRRQIYSLRRAYDRLREKADREGSRERRLAVMGVLDQIESTLVILEEQSITRYERDRMINYVKSGLEEAKRALKGEYKPAYAQQRKR